MHDQRRTLSDGGEPPLVPALASGVKKITPGQAWTGVGPLAARDFKTSSTNGYIWNLWTRYECCRSRGAFLFSIP